MSGERELITRFAKDLVYYLKSRPDVDLESIDHATPEMDFDLGTARVDKEIHNRSGDKIFIPELTGVAYIRTRLRGAKYKLRVGSISLPFEKLYLTNTAQAGKSLNLIVGYGAFVDFAVSYWEVLNTIAGKDFATETTLAALAGVDFATETTLAALAGVDFATQTTLALIKAKTDNLDLAITALRDAICDTAAPKDLKDLFDELVAIKALDFATETTLAALTGVDFATETTLAALAGVDFATQTTLALIKAKTDNLDVALSTVATQATLNFIKLQTDFLDIALSTRASEDTLALIKAKTDNLDVALSTLASDVHLALLPQAATDTPTTYNVVITNLNTEYSQALPNGTYQLTFLVRGGGVAYRYAWVTGKVATPTAPYTEVPANGIVFLDKLNLVGKTLYFACATAGKIMQIEALT